MVLQKIQNSLKKLRERVAYRKPDLNYLDNQDIPYTFLCVDNSLFQCNCEMDTSLTTLRQSINWFAHDEGMYNWAKRTEQPFYTTHPCESAHVEWINMLYDRIV